MKGRHPPPGNAPWVKQGLVDVTTHRAAPADAASRFPTICLTLSRLGWVLLWMLMFSGCTPSRYFIVELANLAQQVPKEPLRLQREPLAYQFSEQDRRLAISVSNPTDHSVAINAQRSFIVDPAGQTHPVRPVTIAPRSYISFALPPQARVGRVTPAFGFGLGVGHVGYPFSTSLGVYDSFYGPHNYYYYDESETPIWRWKEGPVRMRLSFDTQGSTSQSFDQDWTFERRKVK